MKKVYYAVFAALVILTLLTVQIASINLGRWSAVAALTIAACKALLIVLYFMHVRGSARLTWVVIAGGLFWLGILIVLTMSDYLTRDWLALD